MRDSVGIKKKNSSLILKFSVAGRGHNANFITISRSEGSSNHCEDSRQIRRTCDWLCSVGAGPIR